MVISFFQLLLESFFLFSFQRVNLLGFGHGLLLRANLIVLLMSRTL